jgi:hypothetical protein
MDHATVRDVRLNCGRDPEHRAANGEREQNPSAPAEALESMHVVSFPPAVNVDFGLKV